jgi:gamma-glutamyltranspeptidase
MLEGYDPAAMKHNSPEYIHLLIEVAKPAFAASGRHGSLLNRVDFRMNLQAAVDAPTFHTGHFPSSFHPHGAEPGALCLEGRIPGDTIVSHREKGPRCGWGGIGATAGFSASDSTPRAAQSPARRRHGWRPGTQ